MKKKKNIKTCVQVVCLLINDLGLYTHEDNSYNHGFYSSPYISYIYLNGVLLHI